MGTMVAVGDCEQPNVLPSIVTAITPRKKRLSKDFAIFVTLSADYLLDFTINARLRQYLSQQDIADQHQAESYQQCVGSTPLSAMGVGFRDHLIADDV